MSFHIISLSLFLIFPQKMIANICWASSWQYWKCFKCGSMTSSKCHYLFNWLCANNFSSPLDINRHLECHVINCYSEHLKCHRSLHISYLAIFLIAHSRLTRLFRRDHWNAILMSSRNHQGGTSTSYKSAKQCLCCRTRGKSTFWSAVLISLSRMNVVEKNMMRRAMETSWR